MVNRGPRLTWLWVLLMALSPLKASSTLLLPAASPLHNSVCSALPYNETEPGAHAFGFDSRRNKEKLSTTAPLQLSIRAGDAIFFSDQLVHGSDPNHPELPLNWEADGIGNSDGLARMVFICSNEPIYSKLVTESLPMQQQTCDPVGYKSFTYQSSHWASRR